MLIPNEKLTAVQALLAGREARRVPPVAPEDDDLDSNPWKDFLKDCE